MKNEIKNAANSNLKDTSSKTKDTSKTTDTLNKNASTEHHIKDSQYSTSKKTAPAY